VQLKGLFVWCVRRAHWHFFTDSSRRRADTWACYHVSVD